ncbi:hypothetical protein Tco_1004112 [Tanacetum coccineum]|uniref:Uncharacterized protein n=1 Tax=Tanacetum coccineum TaxID=301880 RepID=A0ABQ5FBX5_9ASTR
MVAEWGGASVVRGCGGGDAAADGGGGAWCRDGDEGGVGVGCATVVAMVVAYDGDGGCSHGDAAAAVGDEGVVVTIGYVVGMARGGE